MLTSILLAQFLTAAPVPIEPGLHYVGKDFTNKNRVSLETFVVPRRDANGVGGGFLSSSKITGNHNITENVRLSLSIPFFLDMSSDNGDNQYSLGNISIGSFFSQDFASRSGLWDFRWGVGLDFYTGTASENLNSIVPSTTEYADFFRRGVGAEAYVGLLAKRDIYLVKANFGATAFKYDDGLSTSTVDESTQGLFPVQLGIGVIHFDPLIFLLEYNGILANSENSIFAPTSNTKFFQTLDTSVQFRMDRFIGSLFLSAPLTTELREAAYLTGGAKFSANF